MFVCVLFGMSIIDIRKMAFGAKLLDYFIYYWCNVIKMKRDVFQQLLGWFDAIDRQTDPFEQHSNPI